MSRFKSQLTSPTSTKLASLVLAPILALCGCSAIQVKLGMKVYVAQLPIATMQASLPKDPGIAPGEKSPLVVTFTQPDGRAWMTEGAGKGKILWSDIAITTSVVSAGKKGVLSLPRDPRLSDGKTGHVIVTDRKSTRLNSSHANISYAVFCLTKKKE